MGIPNKSLRPTCASRSAPRSRVSSCTLVCSQCSCARCASAGCRCGRRALGGASAFPRALPAAASPSCCTAAFHCPMTSCFRKPIALTCLSRRGASGCAWPGSCHFLHSSRCPRGRVVKGVSLDFVRALRCLCAVRPCARQPLAPSASLLPPIAGLAGLSVMVTSPQQIAHTAARPELDGVHTILPPASLQRTAYRAVRPAGRRPGRRVSHSGGRGRSAVAAERGDSMLVKTIALPRLRSGQLSRLTKGYPDLIHKAAPTNGRQS